ncbi:MAG: actin-binding WH2 domain-containing protein [Chloroflexota bacterium]|jgi:hypothetical protein
MYHLSIVETILRDRLTFFREIREGEGIRQKIGSLLFASFVLLATYGAVMGGSHGILQMLSSMVKLPFLFLATLAICAPSLHFFNILFGSRQTMRQTIALILTAIATSSVLLFSLGPISFFFVITSSEYPFFKLLNVAFFAVAGFLGVLFLQHGMQVVTEGDQRGKATRGLIFTMWVLLYGFVGSQMAWTLAPFLGDPAQPFIIFRHVGGNFYADVLNSFVGLLRY